VSAASDWEVFRVAGERIAALHPGIDAAELFARMTSPSGHHANLRGKLLLMEVPCPNLGRPNAFYLLGTAHPVSWHGAPVQLLLFGLYERDAIESYLPASAQLFGELLTPEHIGAWLDGRLWPPAAASPGG